MWTHVLPEFIALRFKHPSALRDILSNTGWLFAERILRMGVGLIVVVWVARYLGPVQYGNFNYALAFAALFGTFATLGLDGIVVKEIVLDPSSRNEILGTAFSLKFLGGLFASAAALGIITLHRPEDPLTRWLVGITAAGMIFQAFDAIDFFFQSQIQSRFTVWAKSAAFFVISLVKIVLILVQAPLIAFAWAGLAEFALGAMGLLTAYRLNGHSVKAWTATMARGRDLLKNSWPLILSGIMIMVYMKIDQIMLGELVGDEAVGIFSAAARLSEIWYFIPVIIASSVFPSLVKSKKLGDEIYYYQIQRYYDFNALLAYCLAIPAYLLSDHIVFLLYGALYAGAEKIFAIHIWTCLFVFMGVAREKYLLNEGKFKFSFFCSVMGCVTNVVLNYILIPKYHGSGAAIASLCAQFVSAYLSSFFLSAPLNAGIMQTKAIFIPFRFFVSFEKTKII